MKPVTRQEKRILEMLSRGMSTREVALVLDISRFTVESHRKNLLLKLNAKNSVEMIHNALRAKVIEVITPNPFSKNEENYE